MTNQKEMWAVQYRKYGGPEVLEVGSVPCPKTSRRHAVVKVGAFSINQTDIAARAGKMKGLNGFGFPKGTGADFAGEVVEVGDSVTNLRVGDHVWGYLGMKPPGSAATAAEYVSVRADQISIMPRVPFQEAAALPLVGLTALQSLRGPLKLALNSRLLVVGGNGGVGTSALQIARVLGASADAVVGSRGEEIAAQAGAERTFDYHTTAPGDIGERYDAILDTAANAAGRYRHLLKKGGRMAVLSPSALPAIIASAIGWGPVIRMISAKPSAQDLRWLADHVDSGEIRPLIAGSYDVTAVGRAHEDYETLSAQGKRVVVTS